MDHLTFRRVLCHELLTDRPAAKACPAGAAKQAPVSGPTGLVGHLHVKFRRAASGRTDLSHTPRTAKSWARFERCAPTTTSTRRRLITASVTVVVACVRSIGLSILLLSRDDCIVFVHTQFVSCFFSVFACVFGSATYSGCVIHTISSFPPRLST